MKELALALFDSGIVQFGYFHRADGAAPMHFDVWMFASYPTVLKSIVARAVGCLELGSQEARVCCALDTLPIAVLLGQHGRFPIVFSPQKESEKPQTFIGAYDIGHPTQLLWSWPKSKRDPAWHDQMQRVGLHLAQVCYLLGDSNAVLNITDVLDVLVSEGRIQPVQAESCLHWYYSR